MLRKLGTTAALCLLVICCALYIAIFMPILLVADAVSRRKEPKNTLPKQP